MCSVPSRMLIWYFWVGTLPVHPQTQFDPVLPASKVGQSMRAPACVPGQSGLSLAGIGICTTRSVEEPEKAGSYLS